MGGGRRGHFHYPVNTGRQGEHPTEKPLPLMMELVALYTDPGQTILDPFMGSGTTGVACIRQGRAFIGIEQKERWFELACHRIQQAHDQADMFIPRAPKRIEPDMFEANALGSRRPKAGSPSPTMRGEADA